jgi:hypothetical protein
LLLKPIKLGFECIAARNFLVSEIDGVSVEPAQASGVAVREVGRNRDPLPALGPQLLCLGLELFDDQTIEQRRILQPIALMPNGNTVR